MRQVRGASLAPSSPDITESPLNVSAKLGETGVGSEDRSAKAPSLSDSGIRRQEAATQEEALGLVTLLGRATDILVRVGIPQSAVSQLLKTLSPKLFDPADPVAASENQMFLRILVTSATIHELFARRAKHEAILGAGALTREALQKLGAVYFYAELSQKDPVLAADLVLHQGQGQREGVDNRDMCDKFVAIYRKMAAEKESPFRLLLNGEFDDQSSTGASAFLAGMLAPLFYVAHRCRENGDSVKATVKNFVKSLARKVKDFTEEIPTSLADLAITEPLTLKDVEILKDLHETKIARERHSARTEPAKDDKAIAAPPPPPTLKPAAKAPDLSFERPPPPPPRVPARKAPPSPNVTGWEPSSFSGPAAPPQPQPADSLFDASSSVIPAKPAEAGNESLFGDRQVASAPQRDEFKPKGESLFSKDAPDSKPASGPDSGEASKQPSLFKSTDKSPASSSDSKPGSAGAQDNKLFSNSDSAPPPTGGETKDPQKLFTGAESEKPKPAPTTPKLFG